MDHLPTRCAVTAERAVLDGLGGGCRLPLGVLARVDADELVVHAVLLDPDGRSMVRAVERGDLMDPTGTGKRLADKILKEGGRAIIEINAPRLRLAGGRRARRPGTDHGPRTSLHRGGRCDRA